MRGIETYIEKTKGASLIELSQSQAMCIEDIAYDVSSGCFSVQLIDEYQQENPSTGETEECVDNYFVELLPEHYQLPSKYVDVNYYYYTLNQRNLEVASVLIDLIFTGNVRNHKMFGPNNMVIKMFQDFQAATCPIEEYDLIVFPNSFTGAAGMIEHYLQTNYPSVIANAVCQEKDLYYTLKHMKFHGRTFASHYRKANFRNVMIAYRRWFTLTTFAKAMDKYLIDLRKSRYNTLYRQRQTHHLKRDFLKYWARYISFDDEHVMEAGLFKTIRRAKRILIIDDISTYTTELVRMLKTVKCLNYGVKVDIFGVIGKTIVW